MKKLSGILFLALMMTAASGQGFIRAEYFFDIDPGVNNGIIINLGNTSDTSIFMAPISTSSLPVGFHVLSMRVLHNDHVWSLFEPRTFYISSPAGGNVEDLVSAEYFIDADPGLGNGTSLSVGSSGSTVNFNAVIPIALSTGFHFLAIRTKNSIGKWSLFESRAFYISSPASNDVGDIISAEYFFDADPGNGNGTPLSVGNSGASVNFIATIPASLPSGFHYLSIRTKNENGTWGLFETRSFYISSSPSNDVAAITAAEYFIDSDPGPGNGNPLSVGTNGGIVNFMASIPVSLPSGFHMLCIRTKGTDGKWGLFESRNFYVSPTPSSNMPVITAAEYFFDIDPGLGSANSLAVPAPGDNITLMPGIMVPCLSTGQHFLTIRVKDQLNHWSLFAHDTLTITSGISATNVTPAGPISLCVTDSIVLSAENLPGITYQWVRNGSDITGATTFHYTVHIAGDYSLRTTCNGSFVISNVVVVTTLPLLTFYADADGDTYGNLNMPIQACTTPMGYVTNSSDCNDTAPAIHPGASEICNGIDDDCDMQIDEGVLTTFYIDADGDTYGSPAMTMQACMQPADYVTSNTDCDDTNINIHPGATEACNGLDDNCNTQIDEGVQTTFYADVDGDGFGNPAASVQACAQPANYVTNNSDCDDTNAGIHSPVQYFIDADHDGFGSVNTAMVCALAPPVGYSTNSADCNDANANVHPGANEICNLIDDDCNQLTDDADPSVSGQLTWYVDSDNDGYGSLADDSLSCFQPAGYVASHTDCNDNNAAIHPNGIEICGDGLDNNCNGVIDEAAFAFAGADQFVCDTVAVLAGNNPSQGTGTWSVVSGNGIFTNAGQYNTTVHGLNAGSNSFRWTIHDGTCTGFDEVVVITTSAPFIDFNGLDEHYCQNSPSSLLTGIPAGGTFSGVGINANIFTPSIPGQHIIQYISPQFFGCASDTITKMTMVHALPAVTLNSSEGNILCTGESTILTATASDVSFLWNTGASANNISVNMPGIYRITVTDDHNCSASNSVNISIENIPHITTPGSNAICPGESITLNFNASSVMWSTGATTPSITVSPVASTTYHVEGMSLPGCSYQDSITVTVNPILPPGPVTNMLPADGSSQLSMPLTLSWFPGSLNTKYNLFIWLDTQPEPSTPFASNLTGLSYSVTTGLNYGSSYSWRVVSMNGDCSSTNGPVQHFTLTQLPDLSVANIQFPPTAVGGQNISVDWEILNEGTGTTGAGFWSDAIFLSADTMLDYQDAVFNGGNFSGDIYLAGVANFSALLPSQSYTNSVSYTLPINVAGTYHVFVVANAFHQLLESGSTSTPFWTTPSNNVRCSASIMTISIPPLPDVRVESIINPANAFSGDMVSVTYTIRNFGNSATGSNPRTDKVYITDQPFLNIQNAIAAGQVTSNGNLLPDSSSTHTLQVQLPAHIFGPFHIYVITDFTNTIYEAFFENNNQNSNVIQVFLTPPPDLVLTSINSPGTASNGQPVSISWSVTNEGFTATDGVWDDRVYISTNSVFNLSAATLLATLPHSTALNPGDSYNQTANIVIPSSISGPYYLYVKTDAANQIFEYNMEGNNVLRSTSAVNILNPDLRVSNVTCPPSANAGTQVTLNWQIINSGSGSVFNHLRRDFIFLGTGSGFNINTAIRIDSITYTESLSAGTSLNKQKTVTLPGNLNGTYHVFVFADFYNHIYENAGESNNFNVSAPEIQINLTAWADLSGVSIAADDTLKTIIPFPISYTVENLGALAISGSWMDQLFISKKATWNRDSSVLLNAFPQVRSLEDSTAYTFNAQVEIPLTHYIPHGRDSALYYFYLHTDANNNVFENTGEGNNVLRSDPVFVSNSYVDHVVINVNGPNTVGSGMPYEVEWVVSNKGSLLSLAYYNHWADAVYLSTDTILDPSDMLFGQISVSNRLNSNNTYTLQRNFMIPYGLSGDVYVIVSTALISQISGEINRTNNANVIRDLNGAPKTIHIMATPSPDLQVMLLSAPAQGQAGQPIDIIYSITNLGSGITNPNQWQNVIALSTDFSISSNDFVLNVIPFNNGLAPNELFTDTVRVYLPVEASGNYVVIVKADNTDAVYENMENNNSGFSLISVTQPPPCDLKPSDIILPDSAITGELVNINWEIKNIGLHPASGFTKEGIYFSVDSLWDIHDPLLGTITSTINIPPGSSATHSISAALTSVPVGYHHVLVRADLLNNIPESNEVNNISASSDRIYVDVKNLPLNIVTPDVLVNNQFLFYKVQIADSLSGETLLISLRGDSINGINEIYASFEEVPTRASFDFSFDHPLSGNQELIIPALDSGTYYLAIYGHTLTPSQPVSLLAKILPFEIRTVDADRGGNTGNVTLKINGSKFVPSMQVHLLSNVSPLDIQASRVRYVNSTTVFATFNLNRKPIGIYDLKLIKPDASIALLDNGFQIETGTSGSFYVGGISNTGMTGDPNTPGCDPGAEGGINQALQVSVNAPPVINLGRIISMQILFGNAGNVDIPVPTRFLVCDVPLPLAMTVPELIDNKKELYLEFREPGGPEDILRAGASATITVYSKGTVAQPHRKAMFTLK